MVQVVRKHDKCHMITTGLMLIEIGKPDVAAYPPSAIASDLDFLSVHTYLEKNRLGMWIDTLNRCNVGKPVVIEEAFPLKCDVKELATFIEQSAGSDSIEGKRHRN